MSHLAARVIGGVLLGVAVATQCASGQAAAKPVAQRLSEANAALQNGEADQALAILHSSMLSGGIAEARNLECRVEFTLERWERAASQCEQAVKLDGQSSDDHLWLGRALGEKASRASFVSAYGLAKRVKAEFEEAARLDPKSAEALADLGEFYASAPGVVGGGTDKAEAVAAQLDKADPARAHELRARIAGEKKDFGAAEQELNLAVKASRHPAFQWMTLASFLGRRERWSEMEAAIHSGMAAAEHDRTAGVALYNGATILIRSKRDLPLAAKLIEQYLAGSAKTEEAPAFVAHWKLARLKEQLGDSAAAQQQQAAAMALARDYRPAQDEKH